ncbi:monosaccharide ABC transporter ATP-binding protein, CUT2 family [Jannaschia faecimaris]|uniref:Monosaccharide ABC transporter ATP-binding protein, CUT2 family n=1 Tax=Jannaschia faecimaris TaxID=1244108 RepID=A0A1H3U5I0_9RHOB|nr:monosaccharide ABC transporter ATP-binding protein, CUT2 family [Jannaschia faecimaris]
MPEGQVLSGDKAVPRISLRGIRKTFGSIEALRGVDLDVMPGECVGLIGDNAAGKSTLTKIISGTYVADSGTIAVDGENVHFTKPADARDRHIEMVFQDLSLCDHIDVMGNLFLGREETRYSFLNNNRMKERARGMLDDLDIRIPNLSAKVAQLSGGQRQAIAIARAASFEPRLLIMDEPTSALAVAEVEAVLRLINRVKARGVSVILITHRLQDLFEVCDKIAVMYEGTKVAERQIENTGLEDLVKLIVGKGEAI